MRLAFLIDTQMRCSSTLRHSFHVTDRRAFGYTVYAIYHDEA